MRPDGLPDVGAKPLLTIAIPTHNRVEYLAELLSLLEPQLAEFPQIELLVCDNASEDDTPQVVADARTRLAKAGVAVDYQRHSGNIGSDANFAFSYEQARGSFFWLCGDDDLILPGTLAKVVSHLQAGDGTPAELDMVYVTSYPFRADYRAEAQSDPLQRHFHTIRDAQTFATTVNIMFTFISGLIVNKERLEELPHETPRAFVGTNLVQLAWSLPLLLHHRRSVVLWDRPLAGRVGNANGYSVGLVFGRNLLANVLRLLPNRPDLSDPIVNFTVRRWFPSAILEIRSSGNTTMGIEEAHATLREVLGGNARYWMFVYPVLRLPLPLARLYARVTATLSKVIYVAHLPGFWRRQT
jgi:abequosyltransferase